MKKIFAIVMIFALMLTMCSCGNMSLGVGNYDFQKVHIDIHGDSKCVDIKKWYDSDGSGIEVYSEKYGAMFLSEGSYILIERDCPFCKEVEK